MSLGKSKTQNLQLSQDPDRSNSYVSVDCRAADRQTRIIIISDARLYREGLAVSLSTIYRLVVVGLASTLAEALNCIKERRPDVALLDITMPDALTLPEAVAAGSVPVKIVAFSVAETEDEIEQLKLRCAVLSELLWWKTLYINISFFVSMICIVLTIFLLIYVWYVQ